MCACVEKLSRLIQERLPHKHYLLPLLHDAYDAVVYGASPLTGELLQAQINAIQASIAKAVQAGFKNLSPEKMGKLLEALITPDFESPPDHPWEQFAVGEARDPIKQRQIFVALWQQAEEGVEKVSGWIKVKKSLEAKLLMEALGGLTFTGNSNNQITTK